MQLQFQSRLSADQSFALIQHVPSDISLLATTETGFSSLESELPIRNWSHSCEIWGRRLGCQDLLGSQAKLEHQQEMLWHCGKGRLASGAGVDFQLEVGLC